MRKRFVLAAIPLAFILAACGSSSHARHSAAAVEKVKTTVLPHWYRARFAGFFPPVGARATLPAHGRLLLQLPNNTNVYADGHIITNRGVQRLTPWGTRLLWSKIRAIGLGAGLFSHNTAAKVENLPSRVGGTYLFCSGRRIITAQADGTSRRVNSPLALAHVRALARIDTLFANAASLLPARAWADRSIRPYVPNHYDLGHDRMGPDPAKLPSPAREELAPYRASGFEQGIPTDKARALLAAFIKVGVQPVRDPGWGPHELSFTLPVAHIGPWGERSTVLRVSQDGPPDVSHNCEYPVP